jgi:hypothetical protein
MNIVLRSNVWYTKTIFVASHQMYNHQCQTSTELRMKLILLSKKGIKSWVLTCCRKRRDTEVACDTSLTKHNIINYSKGGNTFKLIDTYTSMTMSSIYL